MKKVLWRGQWHLLTYSDLVGAVCSPPGEDDDVYETAEQGWKLVRKAKEAAADVPPRPKRPAAPPGSAEYKVLSPHDPWFKGVFTPEALEDALNYYGGQGWRVIAVTPSAGRGGHGLAHALGTGLTGDFGVLVFLERKVREAAAAEREDRAGAFS